MGETWSVEYSRKALRNLKKLPKPVQKQLFDSIKKLAAQDENCDIKKLKTRKGEWRLRVGDYRVFFQRENDRTTILVVEIARRSKNTYD